MAKRACSLHLLALHALAATQWIGCDAYADVIFAPTTSAARSYLCAGAALGREDSERYEALLGSTFTWATASATSQNVLPADEVAAYAGLDSFLPDEPKTDLALEFLEVLDGSQRQDVYALIDAQASERAAFFSARESIVTSLDALASGTKLDERPLVTAAGGLGQHQGEVALIELNGLGKVLRALSSSQRDHLDQVAAGLLPPLDGHESATAVASELSALSESDRALARALSAKAFAWAHSNLEQLERLPPHKVASFFGFGFYRFAQDTGVDAAALRSDLVANVAELLDAPQRDSLCGLLADERDDHATFLATRAALVEALAALKTEPRVDTAAIVQRSEELGRAEGHLLTRRAKALHALINTLTSRQRAALQTLRQTTEEVSTQ